MRVTSAPHFERFVRAVHRRLVGVRIVEWAGYGALAGCAAGLLLVPLLWWQGRSAFAPASFVLTLGTLAGFVWGLTHRPTRLAAATEADRQLALSDLLGTATAVGAEPNDPWVRTVLALADDRCRTRFPSQVILNRLGARAWGGIGLAAAFVLTVAAFTSQPVDLRASSQRPAASRPTTPDPRLPGVDRSARETPRPRRSPGPRESPPPGMQAPVKSADLPDSRPSEPTNPPTDGRSTTSTNNNGVGGGAARAQAPRPPEPATPSPDTDRTVTPPPDGVTDPAGGSGRAATTRPTRGSADLGGTTTTRDPGPDRLPPWRSDTWPAAASAAEEAVRTGRVPDAYRDLVRDYFDRQ